VRVHPVGLQESSDIFHRRAAIEKGALILERERFALPFFERRVAVPALIPFGNKRGI
jgi:hypothetical protein